MCGIIGFTGSDENLGRKMIGSIHHRGPDDGGIFSDEHVTIGNRRLAIIDLSSAGHQPMFNKERTLAITFNGEIYNFQDLRRDLESRGHTFESGTDTEVILLGYQEFGTEFFSKLDGMWALAIYDLGRKKIILSRDYFGIKPLYYIQMSASLAFASEIKALESHASPWELSPESVNEYFILGYTVHPHTIYKNIYKLGPGEILEYDLIRHESVLSRLSWQMPKWHLQDDALLSEFESLFSKSVERHLIADVPVGVYLSGGIDSTLIALMLKKLGVTMKAFTVEIPGKSDAHYARKIAEHAGFYHEVIPFSQEEMTRSYDECWKLMDEPIADSAILSSLSVSRAARQHVKVVLTGEGADELFLGYPRYRQLSKLHRIAQKRDIFLDALYRLRIPHSEIYLRYIRPFLSRIAKGYTQYVTQDALRSYIENVRIDATTMDHSSVHARGMHLFGPHIENPAAFDEKWYLPDDLLYKTDFATMAHSIEGRVPYLDRSVLHFARSIPLASKIQSGEEKKILKEYLKSHLPSELVFRKKEGFSIPLALYQTKQYQEDLQDALKFVDEQHIAGLPANMFKKMRNNAGFLELFEKKFRPILFATLALYKSTSKYIR